MHRDKGAKSMKALSRIQRALTGRADSNASMARVGHRHGKRDQAGSRFYVAYSQADVLTPDIDNRSSSAVVAGVHAEIIFLFESCAQGSTQFGRFS
jgi:hypothetical protein